MAAATVASAATSSLHLTSTTGESRALPRRGVCLLSTGKASSPLKLVSNGSRVSMSADGKRDVCLLGPTALAVLAAAVIPGMAEAVAPGVSPSLKNLLLSVVAGGVVFIGIGGVVAAVSSFDPVKRK